MNYTEAIRFAKAGEEKGFTILYEKTYKSKYYLALQYMKNDEAAQDVLQEAYLKAFSKLDTLENPESFPSWLGMIVANTAKNALVKKNPMLFSDIAVDDDEEFEYQIEDDCMEFQPETAYTRQETQRLVYELMDTLSEEQRICILMFHIEGISIREIAAALDCSENTVKSRLKYGRDNLRIKAEALQKKGYKLYSVAPIPLLLYLLRTELSYLSVDGLLSETGRKMARELFPKAGVPGGAGTSNSARSAANATAKSGLIHTLAGKITVAVVGLCIVGGVTFYGISQMNRGNQSFETEIVESSEDTEAIVATEEIEQTEETSEVVEEPEENEDDAWRTAYAEVVQDAPNQVYTAGDLQVVQPEIYYMLLDMDGNDIPELIITATSGVDGGIGTLSFRESVVHIYSYDSVANVQLQGEYSYYMPEYLKDEGNNLIICSRYYDAGMQEARYYKIGKEEGSVYEEQIFTEQTIHSDNATAFNEDQGFVGLEYSKSDDLSLILGNDAEVQQEDETNQSEYAGTYENSEGRIETVRVAEDGQIMVTCGDKEYAMNMSNIQEDGGILGAIDELPNGDRLTCVYLYPAGTELSAYDHSASMMKATDSTRNRLFFTHQDAPDIRWNVFYLID